MRRTTLILILLTILIALTLLGEFIFRQKPLKPIEEPQQKEIPLLPLKERRLLDGVFISKENQQPKIAAIIIDNMEEGRPPVGISKAQLVFEAPAEAGITRFLAFYTLDQEISKIGPIRSLRPYFLEWAEEIADLIAHVGGSPEALGLAKKSPILTLDEFFNTSGFWRDKKRQAPHNLFTSLEKLFQAFEKQKIEQQEIDPWIFEEDAEGLTLKRVKPSEQIVIPFSTSAYKILWQYKSDAGLYQRWQDGELHRDEDGFVIQTANIAVMFAKIEILDRVGRRKIYSTGEGDALIFRNGKVIEAKWKKQKEGRTRFFDLKDEEIAFNPGSTWIEVVPIGMEVEY